MVQIVDELITLLTFDADTTKVEKWKKGMEAATKVSGTLLQSLAGVTASVAGYVKLVAMSTGENYAYARSLGVNLRQYEQLGRVAKVFGGDVSDVQSYIEKWSPLIASNGGDIMNEFSNQFRTLVGIQSQFERRQQAQAYGWSDAMLQATYHAETAQRVLDSASRVQESEYRLMYETNLQFNELWQQLIWTLQDGVLQAGPRLKNIVTDVTTWVKEMSPAAARNITDFISGFADGLRETWPAIRNMISLTGKLSGNLLNLFKSQDSVKRWANIFKIAFGLTAVLGLVAFIGKVIVGAKEIGILFKTLNGLAVWLGHGALVTSLSVLGTALAGLYLGNLIGEVTGLHTALGEVLLQIEALKKFLDWLDGRHKKKFFESTNDAANAVPPGEAKISYVHVPSEQEKERMFEWFWKLQDEYLNARTPDRILDAMMNLKHAENMRSELMYKIIPSMNRIMPANTTINITLNGTGSNYSDARLVGNTVRNALKPLGVVVSEQ